MITLFRIFLFLKQTLSVVKKKLIIHFLFAFDLMLLEMQFIVKAMLSQIETVLFSLRVFRYRIIICNTCFASYLSINIGIIQVKKKLF